MRVLVTGGAGFIGSHVVARLAERGDRVRVVDNFATGKRENVPAAVLLSELDVGDPAVDAVVTEFAPDAIIHLAAQMDVRHSVADPLFDARVNVLGGLNLLEAARRAAVPRVVFASTGGAVYGEPHGFPVDEGHSCRPQSPYGVSKLAFERYLDLYQDLHDVRATILRLSNVFGPRQDPHGEAGVVAIFSLRCLRGEPCTIFGDGSKTRDYVYVSDVVDAFERAIDGTTGGTFNIGRGIEISDLEVFQTVQRAAGGPPEPHFAPRRPGEVERICLTAARAGEQLDWRPRVDFDEGVRRAVEHYRARLGVAP